jgi:protein SCO1/2
MKYRVVALFIAGLFLAAAAGLWPVWQKPARLPELPPGQTVATGHLPFGPVRPAKDLPDITVITNTGETRPLADVLAGHWTAAQFVFTGCSITCPVQGAIFSSAQQQVSGKVANAMFLSISIDPVGDTPEAFAAWLGRFGAGDKWQGAIPQSDGLAKLLDVMGGRGTGADVHDARVYVFSPEGKLAYITEEMPDPGKLAALLQEAAAAGSQP